MLGLFGSDDSNSAIDLLKRDHDEVNAMFKEFESRKDDMRRAEKEALVMAICDALTVHAAIEEEIFYPAARRALKNDDATDLIDEAAVEHQSLKDIIARLEAAPLSDPLYDAGVKVLSEFVQHHVDEEEDELFPKVKSTDLDLDALGQRLAGRKAELMTRTGERAGPRGRNGGARASA